MSSWTRARGILNRAIMSETGMTLADLGDDTEVSEAINEIEACLLDFGGHSAVNHAKTLAFELVESNIMG